MYYEYKVTIPLIISIMLSSTFTYIKSVEYHAFLSPPTIHYVSPSVYCIGMSVCPCVCVCVCVCSDIGACLRLCTEEFVVAASPTSALGGSSVTRRY